MRIDPGGIVKPAGILTTFYTVIYHIYVHLYAQSKNKHTDNEKRLRCPACKAFKIITF